MCKRSQANNSRPLGEVRKQLDSRFYGYLRGACIVGMNGSGQFCYTDTDYVTTSVGEEDDRWPNS